MMELVVTLALMGVLISFAIPAYNGVSEEMQGKRNEANMQTIREAFFHYFYSFIQVASLNKRPIIPQGLENYL